MAVKFIASQDHPRKPRKSDSSRANDMSLKDDASEERPYERLARTISSLIAKGEMAKGDRIPSERDLAERYGVSRTSVREAIIALEIRGVVEVKPGSGIYVRPVKSSSFIPNG